MRMNFGLAQGEQMKPKLTATEERRRRRSESSGGRAPGHEGLFGGTPHPFSEIPCAEVCKLKQWGLTAHSTPHPGPSRGASPEQTLGHV